MLITRYLQDKDFMIEKVAIPRKYHRTLLGEKSIFIHDIESKTNCKFRFPDKESASEFVSIFGPESQVHIAATMLLVGVSPRWVSIIPLIIPYRTTSPSKRR